MEDLEQAGTDAVDRFLNTWNSRDIESWASSLNFPHVRPSPFGPVNVVTTPEDYVAAFDYQSVIESGWDHSEWDYKHVLQISARKIHVAGQWSRYSAAGEVILTTPIVYVCTKIDDRWGIQSRFGADYVDEDSDTTGMMKRGLNLVYDFANHHTSGNREACAELLNYPHFNIGVGEINLTDSPESFQLADIKMSIESLIAIQTGQHSMNAAIELNVSNHEGTHLMQGVINVNDRDGHLGIQGWSILNPNEPAEDLA
jgi:hypothetical protein